MELPRIGRRTLLGGAAGLAAAGALSACAAGGTGTNTGSGNTNAQAQNTVAKTADNPFGVEDGSAVEAVIFNGGYKTDYVNFAADEMAKKFKTKTQVKSSNDIGKELQPRFLGGNPPDLIDNSGASKIGYASVAPQLTDLSEILEANNYEGTKIADTLYPGVKEMGTFGGKLTFINYVMTVYAFWHSASLFEENGWTVPATLEEFLPLGAKAKQKGKYLFVFGKEAASYYLISTVETAVKQGGVEVLKGLEELDGNVWTHPAMKLTLETWEQIIKGGYMKPGGSGTNFTAAQAQWSNNQESLFYASGAWIENEMKSQTKKGFNMTGTPTPVVNSDAVNPDALNAQPDEAYIVPNQGKNQPGGMELLRAMLSKEAATNFAKTRLTPTIVKGTVADDGFGSTALQSQSKMLADAGDKLFPFQANNYYGLNKDNLSIWNSFLEGKMSAADVATAEKKLWDDTAKNFTGDKLQFQAPAGLK